MSTCTFLHSINKAYIFLHVLANYIQAFAQVYRTTQNTPNPRTKTVRNYNFALSHSKGQNSLSMF